MVVVGETFRLIPLPIEVEVELPQDPENQYVVPADPFALSVVDCPKHNVVKLELIESGELGGAQIFVIDVLQQLLSVPQ